MDWSRFAAQTEIYGLTIKGTQEVQGLIAIQYDDVAQAVHIVWGVTAPHNNIWQYGTQKYQGVGGHLIAIASQLSVQRGYGGCIYAEAADRKLFEYYIREFRGIPLPPIDHLYRFMLSEEETAKIREVYQYDWMETMD